MQQVASKIINILITIPMQISAYMRQCDASWSLVLGAMTTELWICVELCLAPSRAYVFWVYYTNICTVKMCGNAGVRHIDSVTRKTLEYELLAKRERGTRLDSLWCDFCRLHTRV